MRLGGILPIFDITAFVLQLQTNNNLFQPFMIYSPLYYLSLDLSHKPSTPLPVDLGPKAYPSKA